MKKSEKIESDLVVSLRTVTVSDYRFLYKILKDRNPDINIVHNTMPSYSKHVEYLNSKPYSANYIIQMGKKKIGTCSLALNNNWAIFLIDKYTGRGIGSLVFKLLKQNNPRKKYYSNVNPKNIAAIKLALHNNFKLLQVTFEFTRDCFN